MNYICLSSSNNLHIATNIYYSYTDTRLHTISLIYISIDIISYVYVCMCCLSSKDRFVSHIHDYYNITHYQHLQPQPRHYPHHQLKVLVCSCSVDIKKPFQGFNSHDEKWRWWPNLWKFSATCFITTSTSVQPSLCSPLYLFTLSFSSFPYCSSIFSLPLICGFIFILPTFLSLSAY